jgi:hypothetical protein
MSGVAIGRGNTGGGVVGRGWWRRRRGGAEMGDKGVQEQRTSCGLARLVGEQDVAELGVEVRLTCHRGGGRGAECDDRVAGRVFAGQQTAA